MIVKFKDKKITTEDVKKASEVIENIDEEAMERNRIRLAEALTGVKRESNIDISLTEKYDLEVKRQLDEAFDTTIKSLNEHPEWFLDD